jgi:hypothetical protein
MLVKVFAVASAIATMTVAPCHASATWYVDGSASANNNSTCSVSAPCQRIETALSIAIAGDSIICLKPPLTPNSLTITKSLTIDCSTSRGPVRDAGIIVVGSNPTLLDSILINLPSSDALQKVRLRGFNIDGDRGIDRGIDIQAGGAVYIEDCVIENYRMQGIYDHRTGGQTKLFVKDTVISNNGGPGIVAASGAPGVMVLDNVSLQNNLYGLATASGNNITLRNSVVSGNTQAGVEADGGAQVTVENSTITNNNYGALVGGTVRLLRNNISFNNQAVSGSATSLGGNVYSGNAAIGATPTLATGATGDVYN